MASHNARANGRELALLTLCHLESYAELERSAAIEILWKHPPNAVDQADGVGSHQGEGAALERLLADTNAVAFAQLLLQPLLERWSEVDARIEATSRSWRMARMDRVDRNLMRLAAIELSIPIETPRAVVLAEAVRLASLYGSERSAPFVNGIVESLARELRPKVAEVTTVPEPEARPEPEPEPRPKSKPKADES